MEKPDLNKLYQDAHVISHENALESIWNSAVEWARKELKFLEFKANDPETPVETGTSTDTATSSVTDTNTATDTQSATHTGTDTSTATASTT